jgi:two-component system chemotaxis response regulator CheV
MNSFNNKIKDTKSLTNAHLRNIQQLAVFRTGQDDIYAINIAKVRAFVIKNEVNINEIPRTNEYTIGMATIRGKPILVLDLDKWVYGNRKEQVEEDTYKLLIYCEFYNTDVCFLIKDMVGIFEKQTSDLINNEENNAKISYITYVPIGNKNNEEQKLCTVFNAEQFLKDAGLISNEEQHILKIVTKKYKNKNKKIIVAEDSSVAANILKNLLNHAVEDFEIFNNGNKLLDYVSKHSEEIGLIITDIEMPETDGYQVVQTIKQNHNLQHIPILVNSSMTNTAISNKMKNLGADYILAKTNIEEIFKIISNILEIK